MSAVAYFAIRDDDEQGLGTQGNPYNGSTDALLDAILNNDQLITPGMTLIFGPGVFQTKGFGAEIIGWTIKDRIRIIGSGMNATVLQLVGATVSPDTSARVGIIRSIVHVTDIEISDLTLDVNLARQPKIVDEMDPTNPALWTNAPLCGVGRSFLAIT